MGKKEQFSIPREGWEGKLPDNLPEQDTGGLFGDGEIALPSLTIPEHADYGLSESKRANDTDSAAAEKTE